MDLYWLQGTELERLPAFASSLAIGLLIGPERERANVVFKLGMVLVVGGRRLFARCAGSMAAVAAGLVVALLFT